MRVSTSQKKCRPLTNTKAACQLTIDLVGGVSLVQCGMRGASVKACRVRPFCSAGEIRHVVWPDYKFELCPPSFLGP